ncbi:MAG: hypothetical protein ABEL76_12350 [Bradymonadaceae bacterium]
MEQLEEFSVVIVSSSLDRSAARGDSVVVTYDYGEDEKVPVPADWRPALDEIEDDLEVES